MNSRTEQFLNKYRELEQLVTSRYNLSDSDSPVAFLLRRPEYQSIKTELDYCREVRNLLTHNPKIKGSFPVEPSGEMIGLLDKVINKIKNPLLVKHIFVPRAKMSCRTMDDYVLPAMQDMNTHIYTHIPILENGVVVGVFSENTVLSYLLSEGARIDETTTFRHIASYLPIDSHRAESFRFIGQNTLVDTIETMFADALKESDRIGLIFVTHSGKPTEKVLGILSAWDMAGVD